jgi:hypothetical protein
VGHLVHMTNDKCTQKCNCKPRKEELLGRPKYRWDDKIKRQLNEVGYEGFNWIYLGLDEVKWVTPELADDCSASVKCGEFFNHLRDN